MDVGARDELLVLEGEMDAVAAVSVGRPAVGTPGTLWRPQWVEQDIAPMGVRRAVVIPDRDQGRPWAQRIVDDLRAGGIRARVVELPEWTGPKGDLSDLLARDRAGVAS